MLIIKQLKNPPSFKNIRDFIKFQNFKNFVGYEKLTKDLVKFEIFKDFSFLTLNIRLVFIKIK